MCQLVGLAVIATAPGKLILTGEYAVLDGAPALVIAVDRRVVARRHGPQGTSPFVLAVARELEARYGADSAGAAAALELSVDSRAFYDGPKKLGLGSSAAVTVVATALSLAVQHDSAQLDDARRRDILEIALAAHANAQGARGARGSGADIAAAVYGGTIAFSISGASDASVRAPDDSVRDPDSQQGFVPDLAPPPHAADERARAMARMTSKLARSIAMVSEAAGEPATQLGPQITRRTWPAGVTLIPFFTGESADTATLVSRVEAARTENSLAVNAALSAIADASRAACAAVGAPADLAATGLLAALKLAGLATDRLAAATGVDLVPACVTAARVAMQALGGTAKTTGAGGGDIAIAVIPASSDVTLATRALIERGCQPLQLTVDDRGVDTRLGAQ